MDTIINNKSGDTNILKFGDIFTLSQFERVMLAKQYDNLYKKSVVHNKELSRQKEDKIIYNISIKNILENLSTTITKIINDLVILSNSKNKSINKFFNIFVIDDRLIYIGILFIIISTILMFIFLSS
jgi:hypothetical protein